MDKWWPAYQVEVPSRSSSSNKLLLLPNFGQLKGGRCPQSRTMAIVGQVVSRLPSASWWRGRLLTNDLIPWLPPHTKHQVQDVKYQTANTKHQIHHAKGCRYLRIKTIGSMIFYSKPAWTIGSLVMSKKVFELVIKLLCSRILLPFYHRMKVIRENFAQSNFFWTARQIECFCLLGFKALWLMVTFLAALKSVDILIFHRRSIFRSLIFGPDFPDFWTLCPHWMFHPLFKAWKGSSENEGIGRVCMGWTDPFAWIRQKLAFHFAHQAAPAPPLAFLSSGISPRQQLRWHFSEVSSANIVPSTHPATQSQNLHRKLNERSDSNWAVWSDSHWQIASKECMIVHIGSLASFCAAFLRHLD